MPLQPHRWPLVLPDEAACARWHCREQGVLVFQDRVKVTPTVSPRASLARAQREREHGLSQPRPRRCCPIRIAGE